MLHPSLLTGHDSLPHLCLSFSLEQASHFIVCGCISGAHFFLVMDRGEMLFQDRNWNSVCRSMSLNHWSFTCQIESESFREPSWCVTCPNLVDEYVYEFVPNSCCENSAALQQSKGL